MVWLGVMLKMRYMHRIGFAIYIYGFIQANECIATPVVEARACNLRDLGSSPSGTLLIFFFIFLHSDSFLAGAGLHLWALCFFVISHPLAGYSHPGPVLFSFSYFLFIYFLEYFSNIKKIIKI